MNTSFGTIKAKVSGFLNCKKTGKIDILIWGLLGGLIFIAVYGFVPLNVTDDSWLLNGYVELDATQHYAGWLAYRKSDAALPLGIIDGFGGTVLTYTDSIPWVAIIFKCFSCILPETFQYFGLYVLVCFVLQTISAGLLLGLFCDNRISVLLGTILFGFSPIMIERAFRHSALASHWLILFMLYFYFKSRRDGRIDLRSAVIPVITIGIHPYFLPAVFGLIFADAVELFVADRKTLPRSAVCLFGSLAVTVGAGYLIGALGASSSLGGAGYGYFSMNLNAVVNPTSCGGIVWSRFLKVLPQTLGNYDGFNYLGLGVLIGAAISVVSIIVNAVSGKRIIALIKRNAVLILLCLVFWAFAVTNVVTLNCNVLLNCRLPHKIIMLASIFRASSRIFYPVFYLILLGAVIGTERLPDALISGKQKKVSGTEKVGTASVWVKRAILFGIVAIQLIDISPALSVKFESFKRENIEAAYEEGEFTGSELWRDAADRMLKIKMLNNKPDYKLAAFGTKYGMDPDITVSSSHFSGKTNLGDIYKGNLRELKSGTADTNSVYVTSDENIAATVLMSNRDLNTYLESDYYIFTSKDIALKGCVLQGEALPRLRAADVNDENWTGGISRFDDGTIVLFGFSEDLLTVIKKSGRIVSDGKEYGIIDVTYDGLWIRVQVDRKADGCAYPNVLDFVGGEHPKGK